MFKKVVFWKVLKRSRCALLKELSTGRLGILIAWDVPRSTASKSMRVERGGREFVLQRPRHRSRWATTTTCFYCWRPLGIRHSRQKAEPSLSLFPILYISNIHDPSLPLSPLVGPLAPLMVRKEPLYYTLYIYTAVGARRWFFLSRVFSLSRPKKACLVLISGVLKKLVLIYCLI